MMASPALKTCAEKKPASRVGKMLINGQDDRSRPGGALSTSGKGEVGVLIHVL